MSNGFAPGEIDSHAIAVTRDPAGAHVAQA